MKKILFVVAAILVSSSAFAAEKAATKPAAPAAPAAAKGEAKGEEAIKAVFAQIDANFAKHDAKAFGDLFLEDSTFVAPMGDGKVIKGKAEIVKVHEGMMANPMMKDALAKHTVENIRMIGKTDALVDMAVEWTGMKAPEGMPANAPMPIWHVTALLVEKNGKWMLQDVRPYTVMPMAPAAPAKM